MLLLIIMNLAVVFAVPPTAASFKDQSCTDPRTLEKHAAYTEWADAYSCTRHRCQPGGRNLAIYTVGCKRVEAPESAIECEEVVEDTNMQFPYCCTRLRCLVVVRGEVWTRVLGQPWETLPAAPWSHMYKMKKPPPGDTLLPKITSEGPIYELTSDVEQKPHKTMRASQKKSKDCAEGSEISPRASNAGPDIVIALSTTNEQKDLKKTDKFEKFEKRIYERKRSRKAAATAPSTPPSIDNETTEHHNEMENDEINNDKAPDVSEENISENNNDVTEKELSKIHQSWTKIPPAQWNKQELDAESEHELDAESPLMKAEEQSFHLQPEYHQDPEPPEPVKEEKPSDLKALVEAIGTRMRDIENVVQKMSEKVQQVKPVELEHSAEKGHGDKDLRMGSTAGIPQWIHSVISALSSAVESRHEDSPTNKALSGPEEELHHKEEKEHDKDYKAKKPSAAGDHYKRFTDGKGGSKYLHGVTDISSEPPLFVDDKTMNGYFTDASNSILRRGSPNPPREPPLTYMAPVDTRRKSNPPAESEESDKDHKKHTHKKKRKGKNHKHHGNKRKRYNRLNSAEIDRNVVSLEDSSGVVKK